MATSHVVAMATSHVVAMATSHVVASRIMKLLSRFRQILYFCFRENPHGRFPPRKVVKTKLFLSACLGDPSAKLSIFNMLNYAVFTLQLIHLAVVKCHLCRGKEQNDAMFWGSLDVDTFNSGTMSVTESRTF